MSEQNPETGLPSNVTDIGAKVALETKEQMVQALVKIHQLLVNGMFPGHLSPQCAGGIEFIQNWHNQSFKELQADPRWQAKQKAEADANEALKKAAQKGVDEKNEQDKKAGTGIVNS